MHDSTTMCKSMVIVSMERSPGTGTDQHEDVTALRMTYSGNRSIWYLCFATYINGTPGTLRIRLLRSLSHCSSVSEIPHRGCQNIQWQQCNTCEQLLAEQGNHPHTIRYLRHISRQFPTNGIQDKHTITMQSVESWILGYSQC
jgi:hypothetical protein